MDTKSTSTQESTNGDTIVTNEKETESDSAQTSISELLAEDPSLLGGEDVEELLQRLSSADSMAQGMEAKLDNVLQDLDKLLALLGAEDTPTTSEHVDSTSAP
jgi:flagellin-like hook-associated protein FlgL